MGLAEYFQMPPPRVGPKLTRYQIVLTALYAYSFGYCGLLMSSLGPSLLTLGAHTGADVAQMGYCFMARSVGYVAGSSLGGPLFDRMNGHRLIFVALLFASLATMAVPFITSLPLLACTVTFQGVAMGFMDVGGNVMLLWLHPDFCDPYMQLIHFCFGAGSTITPLVLSAFMASHDNSITLPFITLALCVVPSLIGTCLWLPPPNPALKATTDANAAAATDTAAAVTNGAEAKSPSAVELVAANGHAGSSGGDVSNGDAVPGLLASAADGGGGWSVDRVSHIVFERWSYCRGFTRNERLVILQLAVYLGIYVGAEVAMGGLIYSYAVTRGIYDDVDAANLNAGFWGVFAFGRLMAIPLSTRVPPEFMLYSNGAGCLVATVLASAAPDSAAAITVATCLYGLFMASCFPAAFALADQYLEVNGRVGTWFVIGSAIGEMVMPIVTASLFDVNSVWLWRIELIAAIIGLAMMTALRVFTAKRVRPPTSPTAAAAAGTSDGTGEHHHTAAHTHGVNDSTASDAIHGAQPALSATPSSPSSPVPPPLKFQPLRDRYDSTDMAGHAGFVSSSPGDGFGEGAPVPSASHSPLPLALAAIADGVHSDGASDAGASGAGSSNALSAMGGDADADMMAGSPHAHAHAHATAQRPQQRPQHQQLP